MWPKQNRKKIRDRNFFYDDDRFFVFFPANEAKLSQLFIHLLFVVEQIFYQLFQVFFLFPFLLNRFSWRKLFTSFSDSAYSQTDVMLKFIIAIPSWLKSKRTERIEERLVHNTSKARNFSMLLSSLEWFVFAGKAKHRLACMWIVNCIAGASISGSSLWMARHELV